ncbi:MAG: copper-binding protein [Sulfuritalea sp.]|nr:copper-binding protein [Sulfuritalea sp.]
MYRQKLFALCVSLILCTVPALAATAASGMSEGVIKKLDRAAGKLAIAHGEIANLKMPPMTMSFKARDAAMLKDFKEGEKIRFRAVDAKGVLTVDSIEAAK